MPPKSKKSTAANQGADRKVQYPKPLVRLYGSAGEEPITEELAKSLLGWQEEGSAKFGSDYLLKDMNGNKVRCTNNVKNRPLYMGNVLSLKQEILRGKWRLNGEPIIIGTTGLTLNGQHTLIALVLACQEWERDPDKWAAHWQEAPYIAKVIVYGIDETDEVVNTMDTCKPRSLADVIYRSEYFSKLTGRDRKVASGMADYAVRIMWHRTGVKLNAFTPYRTHSESLDFISRHPKLLDAVKHIHEENGKEGKLAFFVNPGHAAGLLYLMGCSATDPEESEYPTSPNPNETMLDWSRWDKACDFFVLLASGGKAVAPLRAAIAHTMEDGNITHAERWALLIAAWNTFVDGDAITDESLKLEYSVDKDGFKTLAECPTVGGIDIGDPANVDEEKIHTKDPSTEEIEKSKAALRGEKTKAKAKGPKVAKRAGDEWAAGDVAWVFDTDGEHYLATLTDDPEECDDGQSRVMVEAADGTWEVMVDNLHLEEPGAVATKTVTPPKSGKLRKMPKSNPPAKHKKLSNKKAKVGDVTWVQGSKEEGHWRGRIVEISGNKVRLKVENGFQGAGNVKVAMLSDLRADQPSRMA